MARNKKAIAAFASLIDEASLPSEGCGAYRRAMDSLREYVQENCPYGTRVEVDICEGLRLSLATKITFYRVAPGIHLEDATVRTFLSWIDLETFDLIEQVEVHNRKLDKVASLQVRMS